MKPTMDREWFERRVRLEEDLDVAAGLPVPETLQPSAGRLSDELDAYSVNSQKGVGTSGSPKVLLSYSHDSLEHENRVLSLADRLRAAGIDANIDQYESHPPEGWPLWMDRQIREADYVLLVCTEAYA